MIKNTMKFLLFLLLIFLVFPSIVQAQAVSLGLDVDLKCSDLDTGSKRKELCETLETVAGTIKVIAAVIALITILVGGITMMTAGGSEDKLGKGKKILLYGLIGAVVVFSSSFILNLLNEIVPK